MIHETLIKPLKAGSFFPLDSIYIPPEIWLEFLSNSVVQLMGTPGGKRETRFFSQKKSFFLY